jgi:hypothetical protein
MSITEQIIHNLEALPEDMQQEVLDFLSFLRLRRRRGKTRPRSSEVFKKYRDTTEHIELGKSGAKNAAKALPAEDFGDWEQRISKNGRGKSRG